MKKRTIIICLIALFVLILISILFLTSKFALSLNGEEIVNIEVGDKYEEKGAKSVLDLSEIEIDGSVDTKKVGTYEIKYHYFYSYLTRTVKVVDT